MDSTLINILAGKAADALASQIPALVSAHPKVALTSMALIWGWEHLLALLPIKSNSTGELAVNLIQAGIKKIFAKGSAQ